MAPPMPPPHAATLQDVCNDLIFAGAVGAIAFCVVALWPLLRPNKRKPDE
jgi:hypothetical protein